MSSHPTHARFSGTTRATLDGGLRRAASVRVLSGVASLAVVFTLFGGSGIARAEDSTPVPTATATATSKPSVGASPSDESVPSAAETSVAATPSDESVSSAPEPSVDATPSDHPVPPSSVAASGPTQTEPTEDPSPDTTTAATEASPSPTESRSPDPTDTPLSGVLPVAQLNQADQPAADATGSVTGVVTGPDGQPLEDVGVDILVDADGALDPIGTTSTDKFGAYTFTDVAAGTYSLLFWADGFASVYWGGAPVEKAAETFAVTTDAVTHNVQLAAAATIAGTLKTVDDDPIKDASVHLSWHDPQSGTDYPLDSGLGVKIGRAHV